VLKHNWQNAIVKKKGRKMTTEVLIDGAVGEGGGQMLRTSLTMSAVTGMPFRMVNIRAKRNEPGLKRQHLTCVKAAAEICGAVVEGAEPKSQEITFKPGAIRAGKYRFEIGTAGSVTLVAQTILPVLLCADEPSEVVITGGTHVPMSPSWDFFVRTYLPQLRAMGAEVEATLTRYGFYPAGGGEVTLTIQPWKSAIPLSLLSRGEKADEMIVAKVAHLPIGIAASETKQVASHFHGRQVRQIVDVIQSPGPGNYCFMMVKHQHLTAVFSEIGTYGKSRKAVANSVACQAKIYMSAAFTADRYLSDQLLLPIVLAGRLLTSEKKLWGAFSMPKKHSLHFDTNRSVILQFCGDCDWVEKAHETCKSSSIIYIGQKGFKDEVAEV
jgi:RNA 3'-terminal phosphate cyclase (ATP)